jgi:hypothetical protein
MIVFIFFALMMNVVTRDIQGGIHWCMLFIGDVILVDVSRMEVDQKLKNVETDFGGKTF